MDKYEEKALSDIDEYGCHILNVLEDEENPRFSYSIGIEKYTNQPEIIVTGLKQEIAQWMINEYNNRVRAGELFEENKYYEGFLDQFEVTFKKVEKIHYREYFGWGHWLIKMMISKFYSLSIQVQREFGRGIRMLQMTSLGLFQNYTKFNNGN